jgi:hypothetical protein
MSEYIPAIEAESVAEPVTGLATLVDEMKWQLPGCDDLEIRKSLSSVFRDFCRGTSALTFKRSFDVGHDLLDLRIGIPYSAVAERLSGVTLGGKPVFERNYRFHNEGASVRLFFRKEWVDGVLEDDSAKHRVQVQCVLVPMAGAESAPTWFFQRYADAFVAGALSRLMAMEGRAWFSQTGATRNANIYNDLCSAAALRQMRDGGETGDIPTTCRMRRLPI